MELRGVGVGRGVAVGRVVRMPDPLPMPPETSHGGDAGAEIARVGAALASVADELRALADRVTGAARGVLEATAMMADDPTLLAEATRRIESGMAGERAIAEAIEDARDALLAVGGLTAERAVDVADVGQRVRARLRGVASPGVPESDEPFVLVAADLAPADTAVLDLTRVLALVTRDGGPTGHTAILARAAGLPAVVGLADALSLEVGAVVIVDAAAGTVVADPESGALAAARARASRLAPRPRSSGDAASDEATRLADGTPVALLANVASPGEARVAVEAGAEGVGLLRTEFLFPARAAAPSIAEQAERYGEVFAALPGRRVVVRVLDAGADKPLPYLSGAAVESNPALGLRGLRALRAHEGILRDQLVAIHQAAAHSEAIVQVMAPMVADAGEAAFFVELAHEIGFASAGVTAEVPSIALVADQIMEVVDFVSIGSNDLTQYTLAADRTLGALAGYQDPWHPAVLRLIGMLGEAGARSGIPVGVCGEAAADPALAVVLVGLGATSLSVAPSVLGEVRDALEAVTLGEAKRQAVAALAAPSAERARVAAATQGRAGD